jgi:hypothetical protein
MIGVHAQEVLRKLVTALDVDGGDLVGKPAFLQQDGDLLAIGGWPIKNLDHSKFSLPPEQTSLLRMRRKRAQDIPALARAQQLRLTASARRRQS